MDLEPVNAAREAQAMGRLGSHPHIVTLLDLGEHEGHPHGDRANERRRCRGSHGSCNRPPDQPRVGHRQGDLPWVGIRPLSET